MEKREHEAGSDSAPKRTKGDEPIAPPAAAAPSAAGTEATSGIDEKKAVVDPFKDFKISSHAHLKALDGAGRSECSHCHLKRKYFCYSCLLPMGDPALTPRITLPIHCAILHWPGESLSKSTAVHAKILAPDSVSFHEYPVLPTLSPADSLLLYPSKDAQPIEKIDMSKIKNVVFIDSQWQQANKILRDPLVQSLPHVKIDSQRTNFWRYQQLGEEALATVEAIYYFYREYQTKVNGKYIGEFDNLLFFYSFMYNLIQDRYKKDKTITYTHKKDYIKY